jgi:hypothetical protein
MHLQHFHPLASQTPSGGDESVKGTRWLLLLAAGILVQGVRGQENRPGRDFHAAVRLIDQGRPDEARELLRSLVAKDPQASEAWNNLAVLEATKGDLEAARQALRMALETRQFSQVALRNLDRVVGRMAREAWDSALASGKGPNSLPTLELVRTVNVAPDTLRMRREADSLRSSLNRLALSRDSLADSRKIQVRQLDSVRSEWTRRQAILEEQLRKEREEKVKLEEMRIAYRASLLRADTLRLQRARDSISTRDLARLLESRTRQVDSLREVLSKREVESDSLRRTLARVTQERIEAKVEIRRKDAEAARLRADADGFREASAKTDAYAAPSRPELPLEVVKLWAHAWSSKDVESYLSFYAESFEPSEGRTAWEAKRRERLSIPDSISLDILQASSRRLPSGHAEVTFRQVYAAGSTRLSTRKRLELRREAPGWKIVREESGIR